MLSLFLPLNFLIYLCMFTFIFGGFISIFIKLLINKDLKYIPLIPFVFLSFIFTSLFYNDLNIVLGGTYY
ncbi:Type III leader peptidase family protein (fragment) [Staphylococcus capitis]